MTSSPPSEAPYYRTKALTPESPVPLHVPEPQNIPVLQNQNDIAFNQMPAQTDPSIPSQISDIRGPNHLSQYVSNMNSRTAQSAESDADKIDQETLEYFEIGTTISSSDKLSVDLENGISKPKEIHTLHNDLNPATQPSVPLGISEPASTNPQPNITYHAQPQIYNSSSSILQGDSNSPERSYIMSVSQGPATRDSEVIGYSNTRGRTSDPDVIRDGVNYQALSSNLSSSASTAAPMGEIFQINTASSSSHNAPSPSNAQTPIATLPVPAGLPPRPPPQEKPAIHPNYTPGEDIRSYHNPLPQNSNAPPSYNAQPSSSYRPPQGYPHSNGIAPNGLPPPPLATFQQPISKSNQPQRSPQTSQYRLTGDFGKNGGKPPPSTNEANDEHPIRADTERRYEEFLHDEEVYVSEGTWDRFPQGSRLFVGELWTALSADICNHVDLRNR